MTHEIVKTKNYLLVVDDSYIKNGDWFYSIPRLTYHKCTGFFENNLIDNSWENREKVEICRSDCKKIIAHRPLNNSPILEGVDVLPPLEEDGVEKMAFEYSGDLEDKISNVSYDAYIKGYNKAREKYKYTNEDMLVIRNQLVTMLPVGDVAAWDMIQAISKYKKWLDDYVESLSQPKNMPVGFECEVVVLRERPTDIRNHINDETYEVPKTTTNNLGQTQWVGKYIYA